MPACIAYNYNYSSYVFLHLGSIITAFLLWRIDGKMPRFVAATAGYLLAYFSAYAFGIAGIDLFVRHEFRFLDPLYDGVFELWDTAYRACLDLLLGLIPLYYSLRFLTTTEKESRRFVWIPLALALFETVREIGGFRLYHSFNFTRWSILTLTHVFVAVLFRFRDRVASKKDSVRAAAS